MGSCYAYPFRQKLRRDDCVQPGRQCRVIPEDTASAPIIPGYETIRPLGSGGMGLVFLARQLSLNRLVAIKYLTPIPLVDPTRLAATFRREAELMARLSHPNVVAIYDYGVVGDHPYLVMEYVEGGDLRRRIVPGRPLPPGVARDLVTPIAQALTCLHRSGILHRDLKPANILMRDDRTPKIADFGIAVLDAGNDLTRSGYSMGTPGYVSPEQQYNLKVDERADQYSMAAVFYELLTGRKPLGKFGPPSRYNLEVGPEVDSVLMRGLSEDRDERFASVEEFGAMLAHALETPRARQRPLVTRTAWALTLIGVAVGFALLWVLWFRRADPADPPAMLAPRLINSLDMALVLIRPGVFSMGSPARDGDARPDEFPEHVVRITRPFYLGDREVTVGQFRAFVQATKYRTEAERNGRGGHVYDPVSKELIEDPRVDWRNPRNSIPQAEDDPVVQVTRDDAAAFCEWLSKKERRAYRLPTEAEWEYSCRAGTGTRWNTGDDPSQLNDSAWTLDNAKFRNHPVGRKKPNAWDLYDMHGNVWEWCSDWYGPYPSKETTDPIGPPKGEKAVLRGGSWDFGTVVRTRSASRLPDPSNRSHFTHGFRVAMTPSGSQAGP
jgi:eukaryotic-like serine/threonine-protein kinase